LLPVPMKTRTSPATGRCSMPRSPQRSTIFDVLPAPLTLRSIAEVKTRETVPATRSNERSLLYCGSCKLIAHGEPSDVIELKTVSEKALGQEGCYPLMKRADESSDFCSSVALRHQASLPILGRREGVGQSPRSGRRLSCL